MHPRDPVSPPRRRAARRGLAAAVAAVVAVLLLGACGGDDAGDASGGSGTAAAGAPAAGAFPATVTTKHGRVTVPEEPKRIVALDFPSADAVLALGVRPIAMADVTYVPGNVQTWTRAALRGAEPERFNADADIPIEKIAELRPDLIVGTNAYNLDKVYAKLSRIAPVVSTVKGAGVDTWQQSTMLVGAAMGREDRARRLVADTEARVRRTREAHPEFDGRTVNFFNFFGGGVYAISSPDDFSIRFLSELGFRLAPEVARRGGRGVGAEARLQLSEERLRLLDADVVLGTTSQSPQGLKRFEASTLFRRLPVVQRGSYASLEIGPATAMAFPSALSVQYALRSVVDRIEPLARRAAG